MKNYGSDAIKALKTNLKGTFSWKNYVDRGNHDHKFGPNKFDFLAQTPVTGIVFFVIVYSLILLIGLPIRLLMKVKGK